MKKIILFSLLILPLFGCKKKITQFYIDYTSSVVVSSSVGQLLPFNIYTPDVTTNSEQEFDSNDTKKDKVKSIYLKDLTLSITSPSGEDFSFLNSLEIFISSSNTSEMKVAFKENIGSNPGAFLTCDLVDIDLQQFIKDDQIKIRLKTVTDEALSNDVHIDLYTNFLVEAKLNLFK